MNKLDFSALDNNESYSLALTLIYIMKDDPKYSTINDLIYILDHDNFLNFIKYYEGQTISVPTLKEIKSALRTLLLYQYHIVENKSFDESANLAGYDKSERQSANRYLIGFRKTMDKYKDDRKLFL